VKKEILGVVLTVCGLCERFFSSTPHAAQDWRVATLPFGQFLLSTLLTTVYSS
jgi:hypothetical protein